MAVSTARQWRRRESEETPSLSRFHASSRESCTDMVVTLAEPSAPAGTRHLMEKFVIDGGTPLSGMVVPAGNKNAALPILAASALTADEVVVRNVPRIRDVEAMLRILEGVGLRVEWGCEHEAALCAAELPEPGVVDRRQAELIRASVLLAGPLL